MIKKFFIYLFFLIFLIKSSFSDDRFNFDFDYACFRSDNSKIYLEFYYSFNQNELTFIKENNGFKGGGKIILDVFSSSLGRNVILKAFNIPFEIKDTASQDVHSKLTGQINFLLDTGNYKFSIKACDLYDSTKCSSLAEEISLKPIRKDVVSISSVELATNIFQSSDENSVFYKNTLDVTPNPSKLFGNNLSKIYYYAELYNLNSSELTDNYTVIISIKDGDGKDAKIEKKQYMRKTDTKVEFGAIDISDVASGKYILSIEIHNDNNAEIVKTSKDFYIYNSNISTVSENLSDLDIKYLASTYSKLTEEQVDDDFNKSIYIMTDKNREQYKKLKDGDSKRKFMFLFWNTLDPNPATPESEFRKDYLEKVDFANKHFGNDFMEGWKSDRGRVYCLYGKYDEIERHTYEGSTRAYEIWTYNSLQGGVIFVFVDESAGYGNYMLVHSTARNEINNENWHDKILVK